MADQLFVNNATTTTRGHTSVTATAITVEDSTGFPTPTGGDWFIATLDGGGNYVEIVRVTAVTGNVWTVVRAQEGTTAKLWQPNSRIECRVTAGSLVQVNQNSLRSDLANTTDPLKGDALVGVKLSPAGTVARTQHSKNEELLTVMDFGAIADGTGDNSVAFAAYWAYIKTQLVNLYPASLPFCTKKFTIPPGYYRTTSSINWTALQAWNVEIEANGVVILGELNGKSIIDMIGCRGVHIHGMSVLGKDTSTPKSGILIGPIGTQTCGNNKFTDVKILGQFSIAPFHNIGSETSRYDMAYFMNRGGYSYAADGLNKLGAVSDYQTLRSSGVAVSFTNNSFASCRFENADNSGTYLDSFYSEATVGWATDAGCYFLAFQGAGLRIVDTDGTYRTSNFRINGLFESSFAPGLDYAIRVVIGSDGVNTSLANMLIDVANTHAKTSVIRVETAAGSAMTSGLVAFRDSQIRVGDIQYGATKLFDGGRIAYTGDIACRNGALVNIADLLRGYGTITCDDASLIPSTAANVNLAFVAYGENILSNQGMKIQLGSGASVGFQSGTNPTIRAQSVNANADLFLVTQGTGLVRFGSHTANADAPIIGYVTIKTADGTTRKLAEIA